jgi:predicted RNase H-like HicB family nuclease
MLVFAHEHHMAGDRLRLWFAVLNFIEKGQEHMKGKRKFTVLIERDEEGYYVASVPDLRGCHTQAKTLDTLMKRIREAIELCLEVEGGRVGTR